jgi:DNA-binding MarR family transcriptional regulator
LAGSQSQKLKGLRLHRAADFGKLRGLRQPEITQLLDQLLHAGLLEQREVNQHRPTLYVTDTGLKAIADPEQLPALLKLAPGLIARAAAAMRQSAAQTVGQRTASATDSVESPQSASADLASRPAAAPELVQRRLAELRRWRRETADQLGIPAYRVLPTTAVERLANDVPDSLSALARLPGIAPEIVAQWGAEILQLLQSIAEDGPALCDGPDVGRSHLDERSPDRPPESDASSPAPRTAGVADALPDATDARHRAVTTHGARPVEWTVRLLADGYAWMEVLSARRLTSGQAIGELERLAETGIALAPERLPSVQELREQWAREGEAVKVEATWDDLVGRLHRLRARFAALAASNAGVRQAGD